MSYQSKTKEFIDTAEYLIDNDVSRNTAASRFYYAVYLKELEFLIMLKKINKSKKNKEKIKHGMIPATIKEVIKEIGKYQKEEFSLFWHAHNVLYTNRIIADYKENNIDNKKLEKSKESCYNIVNYLEKIERGIV